MEKKSYYSRAEAAKVLGVCEDIVSKYVKMGLLVNLKKFDKGPMSISAKSIEKFLSMGSEVVDMHKAIEQAKDEAAQMREELEREKEKLQTEMNHVSLRTFLYMNAPMLNQKMAYVLDCALERSDLTEREMNILKILCEGGKLEDASVLYGLTRERVNQIANKALRRMKIHLSRLKNQEQEILRLREEVGRLTEENKDLICSVNIIKGENDELRDSLNLKRRDKTGEVLVPKMMMMPITSLGLSGRLMNMLKAMEVEYLFQVSVLSKVQLLKIRNFGKKSLTELDDIFDKYGIEFGREDVREACPKVMPGIEYENVSIDRLKNDRAALIECFRGYSYYRRVMNL